jgi:hypothetical protein
MTRKLHRGRVVRLQSYVDPALADRVDKFCGTMGMSESALVKCSLGQYLDGTSDATLLLRRLDRLGRAAARTQRDLELLSQAFGVFVRIWFAHTDPIAEDGKRAARLNAESRFLQFVEHVGKQFSGGRRFLDDLPHELIANDAELDAIGHSATASPDKGDKR